MGNVTDRRSTGGQSPGDAPLFAWQAPGRQTAPQRLRRLDALVRELSANLPQRLAVDRLGEYLQRNLAVTLYLASDGDEARPVSESDTFGVDTGAKLSRKVIPTGSGFEIYDIATDMLVSTVDVAELERTGRPTPSVADLEMCPQLSGRSGALAKLHIARVLSCCAIADTDAAALLLEVAPEIEHDCEVSGPGPGQNVAVEGAPSWPATDDGPGILAVYNFWVQSGGSKGGTGKLSKHYGKSRRAVELLTEKHRLANNPKAKRACGTKQRRGGGSPTSSGTSLQAVWPKRSSATGPT